jgi:hypothetical protein
VSVLSFIMFHTSLVTEILLTTVCVLWPNETKCNDLRSIHCIGGDRRGVEPEWHCKLKQQSHSELCTSVLFWEGWGRTFPTITKMRPSGCPHVTVDFHEV